MRPVLTRSLAAASLAIVAGSTIVCSSTATTTSTTTTAAANTSAPGSSNPGTTPAGAKIDVNMVEWEVQPSATTAPAGSITYAVTNKGTKTHELVLFKTDLAPDKLPLDEEGAVDERGAGIELIDEVEDVEVGQTKSFTVDVAAGNYLLVCNLVEDGDKHFGHNMYKAFVVT